MAADLTVFEWQKSLFLQLNQLFTQDSAIQTRPHALILYGQAGIGKQVFAQTLSQTLLCAQATAIACGDCPSCRWFAEGYHPDFKWLTPQNEDETEAESKKRKTKKTVISVDQVRELQTFLALSRHQSQLRIVLISPAEALNLASANALLKMLEEPPPHTLFLLVSHQISRLLPTIKSRCQLMAMPKPSQNDALAWLKSQAIAQPEYALALAGGAPLAAADPAELAAANQIKQYLARPKQMNTLQSASQIMALGADLAFRSMQKWLADIVFYATCQQLRYFKDAEEAFQSLSKRVNLTKLLHLEKKLIEARAQANHPLNQELQLEQILIEYTYCFDT